VLSSEVREGALGAECLRVREGSMEGCGWEPALPRLLSKPLGSHRHKLHRDCAPQPAGCPPAWPPSSRPQGGQPS